MSWIDLINICFAVAGLTTSILGLILSSGMHAVDKWFKKAFVVLFSFLTVYVLSNLISELSLIFFGENYKLLTQLAIFTESLFSSLLVPILTMIMLKDCGEEPRRSPLMIPMSVIWGIYFLILIYTQFTSDIYYITPDNVYHRGPWYPVLLIPIVLMIVVSMIALIRRRNKLSHSGIKAFFAFLLLPLVAVIIQMFAYGILLSVVATMIGALLLFTSIMHEQQQQSIKLREEITQRRIETMTLQMRPHFIYNTLMSIYYLCEQDTEQAQKTILDFSTYLQKNFSAFVSEDTIPFHEELKHTKAYLAVEQVRFDEKLSVEFDTPHTMFRLPPLTLQPIVENAVKYGVDPELAPLQIRIRTAELPNGSEIVVEDTGPGYAPVKDDEPHIALDNIRDRLALMCGGTLEISAREGGGTVVRIVIPTTK